jgi:hypothetical protein
VLRPSFDASEVPRTALLGNSVNKEGKGQRTPKGSLDVQIEAVAVVVTVAVAGVAVILSGGQVSGVAAGMVFSTVMPACRGGDGHRYGGVGRGIRNSG